MWRTGRRMYADCIELFTGSSRLLEHGTWVLTTIYGRWDFSRVRLTTTCTSWQVRCLSYWSYMWMISFDRRWEADWRLQVQYCSGVWDERPWVDALLLGLEVWQRDGCFFIRQGKYAVEILKRFRMEDYKPMAIPLVSNWRKIDASRSDGFDPTLYRQLIGSLMYLVNTQPDISFAVNSLSQFMVDPRKVHWTAAKHILRYIKGTVEYGLVYERSVSFCT